MSEQIKDGGSAFPVTFQDTLSDQWIAIAGMTLRDYFAAKAMAMAWDAYDKGYCGTEDASERSVDLIAEFSYQIADAMLAAREAKS